MSKSNKAKATPKEATAEKTTASNPEVAEKVEIKDEKAVPGEIHQMEPNEVLTPENDIAVQAAAGIRVGELAEPVEFEKTKENKEVIENHDEAKEKVADGSATATSTSPYDAAVLGRPLVADPVSGKPVAESADQAAMIAALSGGLATDPPKEEKKSK